jgi:hypothetical protein
LLIEGVACSEQRIPTTVNLGYLDPEPLLSHSSSSSVILNEAEWTPFKIHYFSENLAAPRIERGTFGSVARNSDHWTTEAVSQLAIRLVRYKFVQNRPKTQTLKIIYKRESVTNEAASPSSILEKLTVSQLFKISYLSAEDSLLCSLQPLTSPPRPIEINPAHNFILCHL